jgi:hypothetical protein
MKAVLLAGLWAAKRELKLVEKLVFETVASKADLKVVTMAEMRAELTVVSRVVLMAAR